MPDRAGTRRIEGRRAAALGAALALVGAVFGVGTAVAGAVVDVTERVRARADLVAALEGACARICRGNRAEARLQRVSAEPLGQGIWRIEGEAALRNRQVQAVPAGLGGLLGPSVTLFDHTVVVRGRGRLDRASCVLVVEAVELDRDALGLSRLLAGEVGKRHRVERCGELLPPEPAATAQPKPQRPRRP